MWNGLTPMDFYEGKALSLSTKSNLIKSFFNSKKNLMRRESLEVITVLTYYTLQNGIYFTNGFSNKKNNQKVKENKMKLKNKKTRESS